MGSLIGISLWVALVTVVPGLITIACLYGGAQIVNTECLREHLHRVQTDSDWVWAGFGVTAMVLTQYLGILLERFLISKKKFGPEEEKIDIPEGIDPHGETSIPLHPYAEYDGLYILLAELCEDEDTQGHLKRVIAQFFLTNNTLISFGLGIVFTTIAFISCSSWSVFWPYVFYTLTLTVFLWVSYKTAVIRFNVMAKSLWATRRRRIKIGSKCEES